VAGTGRLRRPHARAGEVRARRLPLQLHDIRTVLGEAKGEAERLPGGGWSVGECLAHLNAVGYGYVAKLEPALARAAVRGPLGDGPFRLGRLGGLFVRALTPEATRKLRAPKAFWPEPQAGVVTQFVDLQDELLELTRRATGLDLAHIKLASPVSRLLRLSAFEALNALALHQLRHLQQAARVRAALEVGAGPNLSAP
jgi:hypothetical protein